MHPDNKLTNHGKTPNSTAPAQLQNVSQGPTCNLGPKGVGVGNHGVKANQISPGNSGLKGSQAGVTAFGPLKGKGKRERSVSVDSGEQRDAGNPLVDPETKAAGEVVPRSKRRCVLERKQPYSGDEWCSGPDSEEDEKPLVPGHNCHVTEPVMATASTLGPGSNPLPTLNETSSSSTPQCPPVGPRPDASSVAGPIKQAPHFVYVFTTHLANTAAEAVLHGTADSILTYHQQNVPRTKLDQVTREATTMPTAQEQRPLSTPSAPPVSTPQAPPAAPQGGPQQQSSSQQALPTPNSLVQEGGPEEAHHDLTPNSLANASSGNQPGSNHPTTPNSTTNQIQPGPGDPSAVAGPKLLEDSSGPGCTGNGPASLGPRGVVTTERLSKEQLEHRERSLQTLRDIERLLLRSGEGDPYAKGNTNADEGGQPLPPPQQPPSQPPQQQPPPPPLGHKKYEEPLQSMISQTQSLGGPGMEHEVPHHPGSEMGQQMSMMMQRLNQDSLTPEQVAWRKLQEEYYEEKRRKEEHISMHGRPMQDMMQPSMGGMMMRAPPPPYHSKPGEQWPPGMGNRLGGPIDIQESLQLRGGPPFPGPRFPGNQMQRVSGFGGMQNMPMDGIGPMGAMQRTVRPGMVWTEDMPSMGGPGNFPQGNVPYPPGQGEAERFMNPRAREEILRHQLMEKRAGSMQRPVGMPSGAMSQSMEMERLMQAHRQMDPALFPGQMPGDSMSGGPMGMDFVSSRGMASPPMGPSSLRDMEAQMGPGNLNMNMNVNMNMNMNLNVQMTPQQQMMMSQKMRAAELGGPQSMSPDEMARIRAQNGSRDSGGAMMGASQKIMMSSQFSNQGQPPFPGQPGPYPNMPQDMGSASDMFSPDQGSMPVGNIGGTTRLSHIPMQGAPNSQPNPLNMGGLHPSAGRGLGRRPSDLSININQMNSPNLGHLKSPTLGQVHSPMGTSPSANLKSPQTPSQMGTLPPSNQSGPMKSPQVITPSLGVRSPTSSPNRLKSPSMAVSSPGWVPSPKTNMHSPGIPQSKQPMGMPSMGSLDPELSKNVVTLMLEESLAPRYGVPEKPPHTGCAACDLQKKPTPSQNPLTLMMSQMSKYAMPSSTPLYHNAIKTIATSDDELLPDRPMLPPGNMQGMGNANNQLHLNSVGPASSHSPLHMGMGGQQPLSHEPPAPMMSSPNPMGSNIPMHPSGPGPGGSSQNTLMIGPGQQEHMGQPCCPGGPNGGGGMMPSGHLVFPRMQHPHGSMSSPVPGMPMAPGGGGGGPGLQQHYPPGLSMPPEDMPPQQPPPQQHRISKGHPQRMPESYSSLHPGVSSVLNDADLSEVIRPTPTGIPEFDLSRIIPSEKPSSTLQYFPKGGGQTSKSQPSNLHLMNLQNMMSEQPPARPGIGLPGQQGTQRALNMPMCHPGQIPMMGRTGMPPQHGMVHQGMMSPQQSLMAQQNFMLMHSKQRNMSADMYSQSGHMMSPQGPLMGPPNQQNMMLTHPMRQRSVSLDAYIPGPGSMTNLPF
ncbi:B-cell CLL/lymphoma 9-like protein isoform X1 [Pleurodeles waltl]|uniref:B-cell CLL/lymphoma 9-like protein isoform X1 n=1 Tax=Pleurodeles waltl TaxID=8319 RepID=UPI0037099A39